MKTKPISDLGRRGYMTRCANARRYLAKNPPKCGCDMCAIKWEIAGVRRELIRFKMDVDDRMFF